MAMNFNRPGTPVAPAAPAAAQSMEVAPYDIQADKQAVVARLAHSPEVEALTAAIDIQDMSTIVSFGAQSAEEIAKASDVVLRSMEMSKISETSEMLTALAKIMDQFDIDEIKRDPSLFGKLFGNMKKQLEKILAKYHTMGDEVDKIYVQLKQYEAEIKTSNQRLTEMFESNVRYFHELEKYIVAGDQGCEEIRAYIEERRAELERTGDQSISFEIQTLDQALQMLEQRTMDLRTAETVALESIPMIKTMEFSNMNLVRKINSAFIITLPVFKQALAQAIMLKRQKMQADALSALDERTNEMLKKNARNTVEQAKLTTRLASGSSVKAETLEECWRTIMTGITETQKIQEEARVKREEDKKKLAGIRQDFMRHYGNGKQ